MIYLYESMMFHDPRVPIGYLTPAFQHKADTAVRVMRLATVANNKLKKHGRLAARNGTANSAVDDILYICGLELLDICQIFGRYLSDICQIHIRLCQFYHCLSQEFGISSLASWRNAGNPKLIPTYVQIFTVSWIELGRCWMWRFPRHRYGFGTLRSGPSKPLWTTQSCA